MSHEPVTMNHELDVMTHELNLISHELDIKSHELDIMSHILVTRVTNSEYKANSSYGVVIMTQERYNASRTLHNETRTCHMSHELAIMRRTRHD